MARRKTIIIPFTTPGRDSFQITFQKTKRWSIEGCLIRFIHFIGDG
ncbi:MAG: hypothetical protein ACLU4P_06275 [Ruminococcus sp.]